MNSPWSLRQAGFTIVELLIVIVVIGILAAITIVAYNGIQARASDSRLASDVAQIQSAIDLYQADNGAYPAVCGADNSGCSVSSLASVLVPTYMSVLPSEAGLYQYVRGTVASNSYGIYVKYTAKTPCKTGQNVSAGWWGSGVPTC